LDACAVARSEIRSLDGDIGAMFDFVDPDGIQMEFIHVDQAKLV
jgi:glyoxylase I family protein